MVLKTVFAHLNCSKLEASRHWFEKLFGKTADRVPMDGLVEWDLTTGAGFQLWQDADKSGAGTLTLMIDDLDGAHARLQAAGLSPGEVGPGGTGRLCQLRDPDGNLVVLVEPKLD